jgi:cysteinyl-tRNA synthetase
VSAPDSVIKLAEARQAARADKDFALADSLRDQIFAAGYEVADIAGGFELTEKTRFPVIPTR